MRLLFAAFLMSACAGSSPTVEFPSIEHGDADVSLSGDIEAGQAARVTEAGNRAFADGRALTVEIDSLGGDAMEGIRLYRALRTSRAPSVCLVNGKAASAAFLALQGCTRRRMTNTSILATHEPIAVLGGPVVAITPQLARKMADDLSEIADAFNVAIAERLGMRLDDYRKRVADGAVWIMDADAALVADAIDTVVDGTPVHTGP